MTLKNSISLLALFTSWMGLCCFAKFQPKKEPFDDLCAIAKPHPFLCDDKMPLKEARPSELALIDGVSLSLARKIARFAKDNPKAPIAKLQSLKGIGPKTLARISARYS